jgi:hypothetical protein
VSAPFEALPTAGSAPPPEPEAPPAADSEEARGTITGTLRYEDGAPAVGRKLTIHGEADVEVDAAGVFRFENVRPGSHTIFLVRQLDLTELWLEPREERRFDLVIARGATVCGRVVSADERVPVFCAVDVVTREGYILYRGQTYKNGLFDFGWVPGGSYVVAHGNNAQWSREKTEVSKGDDEELEGEFEPWGRDLKVAKPGFQSAVVAYDGDRPDVAMEIALPRSRQIEIRFENLPPEWTGPIDYEIRYMIWWRDDRGINFTLPPSNAIGQSFDGVEWTSLDERGAVSMPAPPPGTYTMSFLDPYGRVPVWIEQKVTIPEGPLPDLAIRLPDGARVIVLRGGRECLAIGPAIAYPPRPRRSAPDPEHVFPRVPRGHHAIWRLDRFHRVRVGEIDVPATGDIRHVLGPNGTSQLQAKLESNAQDDPAELRREADGEVVAQEYWPLHWFEFSGLEAGRCTLVVKGRRIPVVLAEGQRLDLGVRELSPGSVR